MNKKNLTDSEKRILTLKLKGLKDKEISELLYVSHHTIKAAMHSILRKIRAKNTLND